MNSLSLHGHFYHPAILCKGMNARTAKAVRFNPIVKSKHVSRGSRLLTDTEKSIKPVIKVSRGKCTRLLPFGSYTVQFPGSMLWFTHPAHLFWCSSQVLPAYHHLEDRENKIMWSNLSQKGWGKQGLRDSVACLACHPNLSEAAVELKHC